MGISSACLKFHCILDVPWVVEFRHRQALRANTKDKPVNVSSNHAYHNSRPNRTYTHPPKKRRKKGALGHFPLVVNVCVCVCALFDHNLSIFVGTINVKLCKMVVAYVCLFSRLGVVVVCFFCFSFFVCLFVVVVVVLFCFVAVGFFGRWWGPVCLVRVCLCAGFVTVVSFFHSFPVLLLFPVLRCSCFRLYSCCYRWFMVCVCVCVRESGCLGGGGGGWGGLVFVCLFWHKPISASEIT